MNLNLAQYGHYMIKVISRKRRTHPGDCLTVRTMARVSWQARRLFTYWISAYRTPPIIFAAMSHASCSRVQQTGLHFMSAAQKTDCLLQSNTAHTMDCFVWWIRRRLFGWILENLRNQYLATSMVVRVICF